MAEYVLSAFADEIDTEFEKQLDGLNRLGISSIELRGVNGKSFVALTDDELYSVRAMLKSHGISVWSLGSPLCKVTTAETDSQFQLLKRIIKIGNILDVNRIRMFSYYKEEKDTESVFEEKVFCSLGRLLDEAEKEGFILCHENEKDIYGYSKESVKKLCDTFEGKLKAVLDNANFVYCGEKADGAYELLKDYIEYFHIKDCVEGAVIVPPGKGLALVEDTIRKVNNDFKGKVTLTVEPHLMDFAGLSALSKDGGLKHAYSFSSPFEAFENAANLIKEMIRRL